MHGKALGRTIQIPTANQCADQNKLLPPNGVYISRIHIRGEEGSYYGITNVGVKPTVEEHAAKDVETNIVDFTGIFMAVSSRWSFCIIGARKCSFPRWRHCGNRWKKM